ncbi:hypothetical protein [Saccharomonospora viridis]|nr:hypothetical protein [Saccharomonospora viridis]SFP11701.1 hypothetical protein SAMN02982918_1283 [Saccharomonospora viridis]
MSHAGSGFLERLARAKAEADARSTAVREQFRQVREETARRAQEHLRASQEQTEKLKKLIAEHEQQKAEEDPTAKNQWLQRREAEDTTFQFGEVEEPEPEPEPQRPATPPPPVPMPTAESSQRERSAQASPSRSKAGPGEDVDEEDFSNTNWFG